MRTPLVLLVLLAALPLLTPALAQAPPTGACAKSGTTITCDVQLHELATGGLHTVPERIDAKAGDKLVLNVTNAGRAPHNLVVCGDGKAPSATCDDKWAFTGNLDAGQSRQITVESIPRGGTFYYYCLLPGHGPGGMKGELIVQGSAQKETGGSAVVGALAALVVAALVLHRRR